MKKTSQNKLLVCLLASFMLTVSQKAGADGGDWIAEKIEQYVRGQIEEALGIKKLRDIVNSTNTYLGDIGSWLWNSVVNSVTESNMQESAQKFAEYIPDNAPLNGLDSKYSSRNLWQKYSDVYKTQKTFTNNILYSIHDVRLADLAGGATLKVHQMEIDSLNEEQRKASPELITAKVKDYIDSNQANQPEMKDRLIADISSNRSLAFVVNNHPEVLDIYTNSIAAPTLRSNAKHLLHWGITANSHVNSLPKKSKLINAHDIKFIDKNDSICMQYDKKTIALTSKSEDIIRCNNIELLNLIPYPNATYIFNDIEYTTDKLGRVIEVSQPLDKNCKKKCQAKSKLKAKKAVQFLGNQDAQTYYPLALLSYQAPETLINTAFYIQNIENKTTVKNIAKAIKRQVKLKNYSTTLKSELKYNDTSRVPSIIIVTVGYEIFIIKNPSANLPSLSNQNHTSPDYLK